MTPIALNSIALVNIQLNGFAPSQILEIIVAPAGILNPASAAILVCSGAIFVANNNPKDMFNNPISNVLNTFPLVIGISNTNEKGIVAKSAKGNTLFPGIIAANNIVIGTKIRETAKVAGCPTPTAASRPIYNFPFPSDFFLIS